jgi:hypothetical protein
MAKFIQVFLSLEWLEVHQLEVLLHDWTGCCVIFSSFFALIQQPAQLQAVAAYLGITRNLSGDHLSQERCPVLAVVHGVAHCVEQTAVVCRYRPFDHHC